jgi:hypothetical protein
MIRSTFIAALCAPFLAVLPGLPGHADTGRLQEMLRMIPDAAVPRDAGGLTISYGNGDAVRAVARNGNQAWPADNWADEYAAMRAAPPAQAEALRAGGGEALSLGYRDWIHALEIAAPPVRMGVHALVPDSEMRLRGALFGRGMDVATRGGQMVFWEGREDHARRAEAADAANPFGGAEGLATRVVVEPERAVWATGWPQIEAVQAGWGTTLADRPEVAQALAGLEDAVRRTGRLVSVDMRIGEAAGGWLGEDAGMTLQGVFVADVVDRREEIAILGVMLEAGADAEAVARRLGEGWSGSMLARWSDTPRLAFMPGPWPGVVLTLEGDWGADEAASNDALAALLRARENGTLAALFGG